MRYGFRRSILIFGAACTLLLSSSGWSAEDSPYLIPKKEFKKRVGSVALAPLTVPDMLKMSDQMRAVAEAEATKQLSKTKLDMVGIEAYALLRQTMADQIGGLAGADGNTDPQRLAVVWDHATREMRMRHPVDGFAQISIRVVTALFSDDRAEWDGIKQKVKASGDGFALFGGKNYQGSIAAASFQLSIFDRSDEALFVNRGGIEVLQERQGTNLVLLPVDSFLRDEKKLKKAVQRAFNPL